MKNIGFNSSSRIILLITGLLMGFFGGYFIASNIYHSKMTGYENQINELSSEVTNLSSVISELKINVSYYMALTSELESKISGFESEVKRLEHELRDSETKVLLWSGSPKVCIEKSPPHTWWYKGYREGPFDGAWRKPMSRLDEVLEDHSSETIENNFCMRYVNDYNNTIFLVVRSLDPDVKQSFLNVLHPPEGVMVLFREGPATFSELEEWEKIIVDEWIKLGDKVEVKITSIAKNVNGTINIGVQDLDHQKVDTILNVLRGKVPPGILVLIKEEPAKLH